tara:strand:+ start:87 stop:299 length:213 start_codon:yes stop_codon:yes gene_type:complete
MKQNDHTKLIQDVMKNTIDFSNKEKKKIYKDYIKSFKGNLIKTFFKSKEEKEIIERAKNIKRIAKTKTNL